MKNLKNYRHGDMALIGIKQLPEDIKKSKSKVLMKGSGNNNHSFDNGKFYPHNKGEFVFGYFVAENTTLFHKDHGKIVEGKRLRQAKIDKGIYELRRQNEDTHEGMKPVID